MQKKSLIQIIITGILVFVLLCVVISDIKRGRRLKYILNKSEFSSGKVVPIGKQAAAKGLFLKLEEETKKIELKRDPFFPGAIINHKESPHGLYLSGIVWDAQKSTAIINGKILGIGSTIGTNTVLDIKEDRVILYDGSGNIELELNQ